jgi:soluble lytic murein transglycosylase
MPRVPTYDNFQAAPTVTPDVGFAAPSGPNAQQISGQQMQALGDSAQRTGDIAARIALTMQQQVNQVRKNDGFNQLRKKAQDLAYNPQTGYLNLKGDAALSRPDGQDLTTEYSNKFRDAVNEISASLGNDEQRRQFMESAEELHTQFRGQVESHMLGEFRSHALSVQDGTINLASDDAKRNWSDPGIVRSSLDAAKAAVVEKGRVSGWSATQTDAALLFTGSKVHTDVVMSALENNNPGYALSYLNARKSEMTADDILRLQGQVNHSVWAGQALGAVQAATVKSMPTIAPTSFDRMAQITLGAESNGQDFDKSGAPTTSPKGAKFGMQVMPATAANPGHGIAPAANDSPDEYNRVGQQLLRALVQKYGDPAKAWAAYNWGEGNVDKAIASSGANWLAAAPKETQDYVTANVAKLQSNGGAAPRPTELDFVNTALGHLPADASPQAIKLTREQAVTQFAIINKSLNEAGDNSVRAAQQWLAQNNGNFAALPPSLRDSVTQNAPGKLDDLIEYARKLGKGENQSDLVLYNRLAAHPDEMAALSDAQFEMLRAKLSQADFKHFSNERSNYINGKTDESAGGINSSALRTALNARLESLQINPTPGPKDTAGRERIGGIQQFVRNSVFAAQQQAGKKFTAAEIDAHLDTLFSKDVTFRTTRLGIFSSTKPENLMSMQVDDIPQDSLQQLRQAFAARGKASPTNTDLLNAYRTWKMGQK